MCGFSRAAIQVLDLHGISADKLKTYNVLEDEELRSGIKEFSCVHFSLATEFMFLFVLQRMAHNTAAIRRRRICRRLRHHPPE